MASKKKPGESVLNYIRRVIRERQEEKKAARKRKEQAEQHVDRALAEGDAQ